MKLLSGSPDIASADLDHDGREDLVAFRNGKLIILWNETSDRSSHVDSSALASSSDIEHSQLRGLRVSKVLVHDQNSNQSATNNSRTVANSMGVTVVPSLFDQACAIRITNSSVNTMITVSILSEDGQEIRRWDGVVVKDHEVTIEWNGTNSQGLPIGSGSYMVTVSNAQERVVTKTVKVR